MRPALPLVGRGETVAELERELEEAQRSGARVVALVGEPGIGKSRLLAELAERADDGHLLVLEGAASELEGDLPFGPFVDALDDYLAGVGPRTLEELSTTDRAELSAVLPALAELGVGTQPAVQDERYRTHRAVRALLDTLAERNGLALLLDDVHWADDASVELLAHILRRPPTGPVLIGLALRPHQAPPRLRAALDAAVRDGTASVITLGPLPRDAARELLAGQAGGEVSDQLIAESGGNPLYLTEMARSGLALSADAGDVPRAITAAIERELRALGEQVRTLAHAAAVAGEPFEPEPAAAAAGTTSADALHAIDVLATSGLVQPTVVPRRFAFRHPIVRHAVYESAPPGWRLAAHERLAEHLRAAGVAPQAVARHVEICARPGDEEAIALLTAAAQATESRAPATAARWYDAALRLLPDEPNLGERRLGLLVPAATALGAAGEMDRSRTALREVVDLLPADAHAVRARVVPFIALIEHMMGRHGEATALLEQTLADLPDQAGLDAAGLMVELASDGVYAAEYGQSRHWGRLAHATAAPLDDRALRSAAAGIYAVGEYGVGEIDRALELLDEASELFDAISDAELAGRLDAAVITGWCAMNLERFDDAERQFERGTEVARSTGQGHLLMPMAIGRAICRAWRGDLARAAELADDAIDAARLSRNDQSLTWTLTLRGWIATLAGDLELALRHGEEALVLAETQIGASHFSNVSRCYVAEMRLEAGDPERCRREMVAGAGGPDLPGIERAYRPHMYDILARAELAVGEADAAADWAARAAGAVAGSTLRGRIAEARRAGAAAALAAGDLETALRLALEAAQTSADAGQRIEAARSHTMAGRILARMGERERAVELLDAAVLELEACGARGFRDAALEELRGLGRRQSADGALSERERQIAEMVAEGLTNREIGDRLHLSVKTVESSLTKLYRKLEVGSRAGVGRALQRLGPE